MLYSARQLLSIIIVIENAELSISVYWLESLHPNIHISLLHTFANNAKISRQTKTPHSVNVLSLSRKFASVTNHKFRVGQGEMGIAGKMGYVGYSNEWHILLTMPISPHPTLVPRHIFQKIKTQRCFTHILPAIKSKIRWEFSILLDRIKIWKKSTIRSKTFPIPSYTFNATMQLSYATLSYTTVYAMIRYVTLLYACMHVYAPC